MEVISQLTGSDGKLLPSKVISADKPGPVLNIVSSVPESDELPDLSDAFGDDNDNDSGDDTDDNSEDDDSEDDEGYYVEFALTCTNEEGETEDHPAVFNFGTRSNYNDQVEEGLDLDDYFNDSIGVNYPGWTYADEWVELEVYGSELPDDYDGAVVNVE